MHFGTAVGSGDPRPVHRHGVGSGHAGHTNAQDIIPSVPVCHAVGHRTLRYAETLMDAHRTEFQRRAMGTQPSLFPSFVGNPPSPDLSPDGHHTHQATMPQQARMYALADTVLGSRPFIIRAVELATRSHIPRQSRVSDVLMAAASGVWRWSPSRDSLHAQLCYSCFSSLSTSARRLIPRSAAGACGLRTSCRLCTVHGQKTDLSHGAPHRSRGPIRRTTYVPDELSVPGIETVRDEVSLRDVGNANARKAG